MRVVRSPAGELSVDLRGKAPGRGAYLCPDEGRGCLDRGIASGALAAALGTAIDDGARAVLTEAVRAASAVRLQERREKGGT